MPLINFDGSQNIGDFQNQFYSETGLKINVIQNGSLLGHEKMLLSAKKKYADINPKHYQRSKLDRFFPVSIWESAEDIQSSILSTFHIETQITTQDNKTIIGKSRLADFINKDSLHFNEYKNEIRHIDKGLSESILKYSNVFEKRFLTLRQESVTDLDYDIFTLSLNVSVQLDEKTAEGYNPIILDSNITVIEGKRGEENKQQLEEAMFDIIKGGEGLMPRKSLYCWFIDDLINDYGFTAYDLIRIGNFKFRLSESLYLI